MSQFTTNLQGTLRLSSNADVMADVLEDVAPILNHVMKVRMFDLMDHHRRSVLKHHKLRRKDEGRRYIASRFHRYSRMLQRTGVGSDPRAVVAEAFLAAQSGETFGPNRFVQLEYGGRIKSKKPMIIPFPWLSRNQMAQLHNYALQGVLDFVPRPGRPTLAIYRPNGLTAATKVLGIIARARSERPQLGFRAQWESVLPRHQAKLERSIEMAISEAGRRRLDEQINAVGKDANVRFVLGKGRRKARSLAQLRAEIDAAVAKAKQQSEPETGAKV